MGQLAKRIGCSISAIWWSIPPNGFFLSGAWESWKFHPHNQGFISGAWKILQKIRPGRMCYANVWRTRRGKPGRFQFNASLAMATWPCPGILERGPCLGDRGGGCGSPFDIRKLNDFDWEFLRSGNLMIVGDFWEISAYFRLIGDFCWRFLNIFCGCQLRKHGGRWNIWGYWTWEPPSSHRKWWWAVREFLPKIALIPV